MKNESYSHVTPGRLRIKIPMVKGSQDTAQQVEQILRGVEGINSVTANPLTGNALVLFDSESLAHTDVIDILISRGFLERKFKGSRRTSKRASFNRVLEPDHISKAIADVLFQAAVEFAVKRALLALV